MTMKTSYRKIYLFLLLLTSYSCNDLTETNMSIDIISMTKYNNIINIDSSAFFTRWRTAGKDSTSIPVWAGRYRNKSCIS